MHSKASSVFHDIICTGILFLSSIVGLVRIAHILSNYISDTAANVIGFALYLATVLTYDSIKSSCEKESIPAWKEKAEAYDDLNYLLSEGYFIEGLSEPIKSAPQLMRLLEFDHIARHGFTVSAE